MIRDLRGCDLTKFNVLFAQIHLKTQTNRTGFKLTSSAVLIIILYSKKTLITHNVLTINILNPLSVDLILISKH